MAPPWSCFGKRLHFLKVEPFFSTFFLVENGTTLQSGTKTVPSGHENGSTLEPFRLHFFLSVLILTREGSGCLTDPVTDITCKIIVRKWLPQVPRQRFKLCIVMAHPGQPKGVLYIYIGTCPS